MNILVFFVLLVFCPEILAEKNFRTPEVIQFANDLSEKSQYQRSEILNVLNSANHRQIVIDNISKPAEKTLSWGEYRDIFLDKARLDNGKIFMKDNHLDLARVEAEFGIPAEIVTAIIGVETRYGKIMGSHPVLDSLATLAFYYPPRSSFFREELKELFLMTREENLKIDDLKGSYAGAMGMGQFIPSSFRRYAVDFDLDGNRNLWEQPSDSIGSVGNYLYEHGWRRKELVAIEVDGDCGIFSIGDSIESAVFDKLHDCLPKSSDRKNIPSRMVMPLKLAVPGGYKYWAGFWNFSVLMKYNRSDLYAMAVVQLSEAFKKSD